MNIGRARRGGGTTSDQRAGSDGAIGLGPELGSVVVHDSGEGVIWVFVLVSDQMCPSLEKIVQSLYGSSSSS